MASGKPVIASDIGGNLEIVDHNVSGLLVQPGDQFGLAQAINAVAADEGLRRRLSEGALQKVKAFKASNVVPRIEAVYRDVLARKRPAAVADSHDIERFSARRVGGDRNIGLREVGGEDAR